MSSVPQHLQIDVRTTDWANDAVLAEMGTGRAEISVRTIADELTKWNRDLGHGDWIDPAGVDQKAPDLHGGVSFARTLIPSLLDAAWGQVDAKKLRPGRHNPSIHGGPSEDTTFTVRGVACRDPREIRID